MSAQTNIYNWKFNIVVDQSDVSILIGSPINRNRIVFKCFLKSLSAAFETESRLFEYQTYRNEDDGRLRKGSLDGKCTKEIEIDLAWPGNLQSLVSLKFLDETNSGGKIASKQEAINLFRISGREKNSPSAIHVLGYDEKGLFLADMRKSWVACKQLEAQPLF